LNNFFSISKIIIADNQSVIKYQPLFLQKVWTGVLVNQPEGIINGNRSINAFFTKCLDEDAIYIRLDDDIVWIEPEFFEKMVKFRVENPDYFIVSPLVINNALSTYLMQVTGKIQLNHYYRAACMENTLWKSGDFAFQLHEWFIRTKLLTNSFHELYCGKHPIAMNRFSINSIVWFGKDFKQFNGIVLMDEEEYVSVFKPTELGLSNCINGDAVIVHFAFFTQRDRLDKTNILGQYASFLQKIWQDDPEMTYIFQQVQAAMADACSTAHVISTNRLINSSRLSLKEYLKKYSKRIKVPLIKLYSLPEIYSRLKMRKTIYILSE
jgi:hypothetical protein